MHRASTRRLPQGCRVSRLGPVLARAGALRAEYEAATPWPHLVVHDLFPPGLLEQAKAEGMAVARTDVKHDENRAQVKDETPTLPGPACEALFEVFHGPEFMAFLEQVTGVADLEADPTHRYGGLHRFPPGGFTLVHRDFRRHPVTRLHHRVNVLLYLNAGWRPEYGGHLELWPSDMSGVGRTISPSSNTLIIWETHDQTLHGLPEPLRCPPDDARVALAAYYYTHEPRRPAVKKRGPVVVRRPQDPWHVGRRKPKELLVSWLFPGRAF